MKGPRNVEIPLPEGARASEEELELLGAAFRAIVALHYGSGREWKKDLAALEKEGWKVHCELIWRAVAVKGHDYEEATGANKAEALARLSQLTGLDAVQGCP